MTFTYDPTIVTDIDRIRLNISDTDADAAMFQDEELTALLTAEGSVLGASVRAAGLLVIRYRALGKIKVGDVSIDANQIADSYEQLASDLEDQIDTSGSAAPYAGGLTVSDVQARERNTDLVDPFFSRTKGDNPPSLRDRNGGWPC